MAQKMSTIHKFPTKISREIKSKQSTYQFQAKGSDKYHFKHAQCIGPTEEYELNTQNIP